MVRPSPLSRTPPTPTLCTLPPQVAVADAEKRAKELGWQVKMLADLAGSPGGWVPRRGRRADGSSAAGRHT